MKRWFSVGLILVLHFGIASNALPYTVIDYSPARYLGGTPGQLATMEIQLGISGFVIEDFFDSDLVPGLTIVGPPYLGSNDWPNAWGDPESAAFIAYPTSTDPATIEITPGADMVGIGIGYMEYESLPSLHSIMTINNDEAITFTPENFLNFTFATVTRNGYITIARDAGDPPITSITFHTSITDGDAYSFDYIAIQFLQDTDGDGIPDDEDQCVNSDLSLTVVIDGCDSLVLNSLFPNGCTLSDNLAKYASDAINHGKFVSAVAHYTNELKKNGVISGKQKGAIQSCAGQ